MRFPALVAFMKAALLLVAVTGCSSTETLEVPTYAGPDCPDNVLTAIQVDSDQPTAVFPSEGIYSDGIPIDNVTSMTVRFPRATLNHLTVFISGSMVLKPLNADDSTPADMYVVRPNSFGLTYLDEKVGVDREAYDYLRAVDRASMCSLGMQDECESLVDQMVVSPLNAQELTLTALDIGEVVTLTQLCPIVD